MKQERLASLSDGIFAIVMTLLVLTLVVPKLTEEITNAALWQSLVDMKVSFLSYILSFALLFTYWNAHHFIISVYAKNIDFKLTVLNAIFLLLVALIPFSTYFLGLYSFTELAVIIYAFNIILISSMLYTMKHYVIYAQDIEAVLSERDIRHGNIRIFLPLVFAVLAILFSFLDTKISLFLFTFAVLFNLIPSSTDLVVWVMDGLKGK